MRDPKWATRPVTSLFSLISMLSLAAVAAASPSHANEEGEAIVVEDGKTISIEYTLKLEDGTVADSSEGRDPLQYVQGGQQILPALEARLEGMEVGQEKSVTLTAAEGYGEVDPGLLQEVPASAVPEEGRKAGSQLMSQDQQGNQQIIRVHEVKGDAIVLDFNHPLAGEDLQFDVKVVGIE